MRINRERLVQMALRYATTRPQRHHIQNTRWNWLETRPCTTTLLPYIPDTHPEYISTQEIADEQGLAKRTVDFRYEQVISSHRLNDGYYWGSFPKAFYEASKRLSETNDNYIQNRRTLKKIGSKW